MTDTTVVVQIKSITIRAVHVKADGTETDLGVVAQLRPEDVVPVEASDG